MPARTPQPRNRFTVTDLFGREVLVEMDRKARPGSTLLVLRPAAEGFGRPYLTEFLYDYGIPSRLHLARAEVQTDGEHGSVADAMREMGGVQPFFFVTEQSGSSRLPELMVRITTFGNVERTWDPRLKLLRRDPPYTGLYSVMESYSEVPIRPFLFDEQTATTLVERVNAYIDYYVQGHAATARTEQKYARLGGERVSLGLFDASHRVSYRNGMTNGVVEVFYFPRSGTDIIEVVPDRSEQKYETSLSELYQLNYYRRDPGLNMYVIMERSYPLVTMSRAELQRLVTAVNAGMQRYAAGGVPAYPNEVTVVVRGRGYESEIPAMAVYDGKSAKGIGRIKLVPQHRRDGRTFPKSLMEEFFVFQSDGFKQPYTDRSGKKVDTLHRVPEDTSSALMVMLDSRYEQGLSGIVMEDGSIMLHEVESTRNSNEKYHVTFKLTPTGYGRSLSWMYQSHDSSERQTGTDHLYNNRERLDEFASGKSLWLGSLNAVLNNEGEQQQLRVWMDQMMEEGKLNGLSAAEPRGDGGFIRITGLKWKIQWAPRPESVTQGSEAELWLQTRTFNSPRYEDPARNWMSVSLRFHDGAAPDATFPINPLDGDAVREVLQGLVAGQEVFLGFVYVRMTNPDDRAALQVWMDQQVEKGKLSGVTDVLIPHGNATKKWRFKMVRDLGCGLYIGQPSKASKLSGPYQLLLKNNGLRVVSGDDVDLLADLAVMLTSIPGTCEQIESMSRMPYQTQDQALAVRAAWRDFWFSLPDETKADFQKHLKLLTEEKLVRRRREDE